MNRHPARARSSAEDMLRFCLKIERLISGMSEDQFYANETTVDSVILSISNIGEAAKRLMAALPDPTNRFPTLPLSEVYSMRNRLIHGYDVVDFKRVWDTAARELPPVRVALEAILANWPLDLL